MATSTPLRGFNTGLPVIRIASGSTVKRICHFHPLNNEPRLLRCDYAPFAMAAPGLMADGTVYTYEAGVRFVYRMTFEIWHPQFRIDTVQPTEGPMRSFTEVDYRWLSLARSLGYTVELFPSTDIEQGTPPHPVFNVNLDRLELMRIPEEDGRIVWRADLEASGVSPVTTEMPEFI
jgi:hypothetical protein